MKKVYLADNDIGDSGIRELGTLPKLETLDISRNLFRPTVLQQIAAPHQFKSLRHLNVSANRLRASHLQVMKGKESIDSLNASGNPIGGETFDPPVNAKELGLTWTQLTTVSAQAMSKYQQLNTLDIRFNSDIHPIYGQFIQSASPIKNVKI